MKESTSYKKKLLWKCHKYLEEKSSQEKPVLELEVMRGRTQMSKARLWFYLQTLRPEHEIQNIPLFSKILTDMHINLQS